MDRRWRWRTNEWKKKETRGPDWEKKRKKKEKKKRNDGPLIGPIDVQSADAKLRSGGWRFFFCADWLKGQRIGGPVRRAAGEPRTRTFGQPAGAETARAQHPLDRTTTPAAGANRRWFCFLSFFFVVAVVAVVSERTATEFSLLHFLFFCFASENGILDFFSSPSFLFSSHSFFLQNLTSFSNNFPFFKKVLKSGILKGP